MTSPLPVDRTLLNSPPASATAGAAGTQGGTPIVATPSKVGFNVPVSPREAGFAAAPSTPSGIRQRRTGRANGTNPERQFTYSEIDVRACSVLRRMNTGVERSVLLKDLDRGMRQSFGHLGHSLPSCPSSSTVSTLRFFRHSAQRGRGEIFVRNIRRLVP
ncbi:hypothetical protein FRC18_010544 [Serendipita sp. 400]|nr:hypothetical protein FRC18_010544 [Serendipita sp. 400]